MVSCRDMHLDHAYTYWYIIFRQSTSEHFTNPSFPEKGPPGTWEPCRKSDSSVSPHGLSRRCESSWDHPGLSSRAEWPLPQWYSHCRPALPREWAWAALHPPCTRPRLSSVHQLYNEQNWYESHPVLPLVINIKWTSSVMREHSQIVFTHGNVIGGHKSWCYDQYKHD